MLRTFLHVLVPLFGCAACIDTSGLVFDRAGGPSGGAGGSGGSTARTYGDVIMEDDPIGYWPLDDVVNGTRTPDEGGDELDAYLDDSSDQGTLTFGVAGKVGTAATLENGASLFVDVAAALGLGETSYTLEAWVSVTASEASSLWSCTPDGGGDGYHTFLWETALTHKRYGGGDFEEIAHDPIAFDQLKHVVVTFDMAAQEAQIYLNGTPTKMPPVGLSLSWQAAGNAFELAHAGSGDNITVDEVAVFATALPLERVEKHYQCAEAQACD